MTCPAGQYAYRHLSCRDCTPGSYSDSSCDACKSCGVGKVSTSKATSCTVCPAGQYADQKTFLCTPCKKDTYSTGSVDYCSLCQSGSYSGVGESECHACTPGEYFNSKAKKCVACQPSFYSPNPYTKCKKCPSGQYSGAKEKICHSCPAGTKVNAAQTGCETGPTPTPSFPPTSPPSSPTTGFQRCALGLYYDQTKDTCVKCAPGFYTVDSLKPCTKCPYGYYTPPDATNALPYGTCTKCAFVTTPDKTECHRCKGGYMRKVYYTGTDLFPPYPESECVRCPVNTYAPGDTYQQYQPPYVPSVADDTMCFPCIYPDGTNVDQNECNPEQYSSPPTNFPTARPTHAGNCKRGQEEIPITTTNPDGCAPCKQSYYSPYPSIPCKKCPAGQYSGYGERSCHTCPAGQTADASQTSCIVLPSSSPTARPSFKKNNCRPGSYYNGILDKCEICQPGTYSPDPIYECMPCGPRTYADRAGLAHCSVCADVVSNGRTKCSLCEAGRSIKRYYDDSDNEILEPTCDLCQYMFGFYYWSGPNDYCHLCPYGYWPNDEHTGCVIDPNKIGLPTMAPNFIPPTQSPTEQKCELGSVLEWAEWTETGYKCVPCKASYYHDVYCKKCPAGKYSSGTGNTKCRGCPVGTSVNDFQTGCE